MKPHFHLRDLLWLAQICVIVALPDQANGCGLRRRRHRSNGRMSPAVPITIPQRSTLPVVFPKVVGFRTELLGVDGWEELKDDD